MGALGIPPNRVGAGLSRPAEPNRTQCMPSPSPTAAFTLAFERAPFAFDGFDAFRQPRAGAALDL